LLWTEEEDYNGPIHAGWRTVQMRLEDVGAIVHAKAKLCPAKGRIKLNAKPSTGIGVYARLRGKERGAAGDLLPATQIRSKYKLVVAIGDT
jgi:hypothetical protein